MNRILPLGLVTFTILTIFLVYRASNDNLANLSPQGCRMSWMSPSYVLQSDFNHSWTTLSSRYSLWLYREVGWDASGAVSRLAVGFPSARVDLRIDGGRP